MVINTLFHIFFSNSKKFQLIESQPTTNNARSAIFGVQGHGQSLTKMQRNRIKGPQYGIFVPEFMMDMDWDIYKNAASALWEKRELGTISILLALEVLIKFWSVIFENEDENNLI